MNGFLETATLYVSFWKQWCCTQFESQQQQQQHPVSWGRGSPVADGWPPLPETKQGSQIEFSPISQFPALMSRCILDQTHLVFPPCWDRLSRPVSPNKLNLCGSCILNIWLMLYIGLPFSISTLQICLSFLSFPSSLITSALLCFLAKQNNSNKPAYGSKHLRKLTQISGPQICV